MSVLSDSLRTLYAPHDKQAGQQALEALSEFFGISLLPYAEQGPAFVALAAAVDKLKDEPRADPEEFIRSKLKRGKRNYYEKELGREIKPPASTNSARRKKGQREHQKLARGDGAINDRWGDESRDTYLDVGGREPEKPGVSEFELIDALKLSEHETKVWRLRREGYSRRKVAEQLGIYESEVRAIDEMFAERAQRAGF